MLSTLAFIINKKECGMRGLKLCVLAFLLVLSCKKVEKRPVQYSPSPPIVGKEFNISYNIKGKGYLLIEFTVPDIDSTIVEEIEGKGSFAIKIPENAENIRLKVVSDTLEWESQYLPLYTPEGKPVRETYYNIANEFLRGRGWKKPCKDSAIIYVEKELQYYPESKRALALSMKLSLLKEEIRTILDTLKDDELAFYIASELWMHDEVIKRGKKILNKMEGDKRRDVLFDMAIASYVLGKKKEGEEYFDKLKKEYPNYRIGLLYRALFYTPKGEDDPKSLMLFKEYIEKNPSDYQNISTSLVDELIKKHKYEEALKLEREAIEHFNDEKWVLKVWGFYPRTMREKIRKGRLAEANLRLGRIFEKLGKEESIANAYMKAIELAPEESKGYYFDEVLKALEKLRRDDLLMDFFKNYWRYSDNPDSILDVFRKLYKKMKGDTLGFGEYAGLNISGEIAPDFEVKDLEGRTARLSDMKGKTVVINFWATWCGPCIREIPELNEVVEDFSETPNVVFWAISHEDREKIKEFLKKHPFKYRIFAGGGDVFKKYGIMGIPTHVIVDKNGRIYRRFIGYTPNIKEKLERAIEKLFVNKREVS